MILVECRCCFESHFVRGALQAYCRNRPHMNVRWSVSWNQITRIFFQDFQVEQFSFFWLLSHKFALKDFQTDSLSITIKKWFRFGSYLCLLTLSNFRPFSVGCMPDLTTNFYFSIRPWSHFNDSVCDTWHIPGKRCYNWFVFMLELNLSSLEKESLSWKLLCQDLFYIEHYENFPGLRKKIVNLKTRDSICISNAAYQMYGFYVC